MIPATYPSKLDENNTTQMVVYYLSSVSGLERWKDYIPVQFDAVYDNGNSFGNNDVMIVEQNSTGQAGKDYTNVFEEGTVRWSADETGFIPVQFFGV